MPIDSMVNDLFVMSGHDREELTGYKADSLGAIVSLGLAIALLLYSFQGLVAPSLGTDQQSMTLLLLLIFLAPVQALDGLLVGMFAVFASPRSIFFRKYVLGPGL